MKFVSVILARGGSKGIPNKNITPIRGRPLIDYAIKTSLSSDVEETYVSTDCENIKLSSIQSGAMVIDRPKEISGDHAQSEDALLHFAEVVDFDYLVFIQPTSPLLKPEYINEGISLIKNKEADSVFSAHKMHWIPSWNTDINPIDWDIKNRPMRQDMDEFYIENGAFYITSKKRLLDSKLRYSGKIKVVEMSMLESFQIDTHDDLDLITKLMSI